MTILVTGSTGKVGSEVLKELGKRKVTVRALVRKPNAKLPKGVEAVVGDLLDPVSVETALDGVDKLYLLKGVVKPVANDVEGEVVPDCGRILPEERPDEVICHIHALVKGAGDPLAIGARHS